MTEDLYDFVIVGAGPAGLTAGIIAARAGFRAVIVEKGNRPGPRPRGEGVHHFPLFDDLLGEGFLRDCCYQMDGSGTYHSPGDRHQITRAGESTLYFFEWRDFIDTLADAARDLGVEIRTNLEVMAPIERAGRVCTGVKCREKDGAVTNLYGSTVLACDGHESRLGHFHHIPYDRLNCLMVKGRIGRANFDLAQTSALQFYLIGNGDLPYEPRFPPCVAYAFPLADQKMEVGLMLRMMHARKMRKTLTPPDRRTFKKTWQQIKTSYPGFSDLFTGATIEHEEVTALPNAEMVRNYNPGPGLVLIGDAAGFIDPFGSSGIY